MSKHPPADRDAHRSFCVIEGWEERPSARGRRGQDHVKYELRLDDGRVLLTRISHPVDRSTYSRSMWTHILRDQLDVTEDEFWACVNDRAVPSRGRQPQPGPSLPAWLVRSLLDAGLPAEEIAAMDEARAKERIARIWSKGADGGPTPS